MKHNILMFAPAKERLATGGGIRPYYLSKELNGLGVNVSEIWGWKTKSLTLSQIKNKMRLLRYLLGSKKEKFYLVECAKSERAMKALFKAKIPIILDFFDDEILQKEAYGIPISEEALTQAKRDTEFSLSMAKYVLFPSKTLMKHYPQEIQEKSIVIMNASDLSHFKNAPLPENPTIGILTGLTAGRGIEELLEACLILKKDYDDLNVNIGYISKGGVALYEKEIKKKYRIDWVNFREDITYFCGAREFYESCYLTVIPNLKHFYMDASTPIKLFDSMASARPVVVTDCYEQAKIVKDENCGLVCDFTPEDMAEKISKLLADRELAEKMGQNGRKAIEEGHSWTHRAKKLYNEMWPS